MFCFAATMQPISTRSYANFRPQLRQTSYVQPDSVNGRLTLRCQQPKRNSRACNSVFAIVVYQQFVYTSRRAFAQTETAAPLQDRCLGNFLLRPVSLLTQEAEQFAINFFRVRPRDAVWAILYDQQLRPFNELGGAQPRSRDGKNAVGLPLNH